MDYFNFNAFILGTLLCACLCFSNLAYSAFCLLNKIKILAFVVFNKPWFCLHKVEIMGTELALGWLPISTYIRADYDNSGSNIDVDNSKSKSVSSYFTADYKDSKNDTSNRRSQLTAYFDNKPKYHKTLFDLIPFFSYVIAFFIAFFIFSSPGNFQSDFLNLTDYVLEALKGMFTHTFNRNKFITTSQALILGKNIIACAFILLAFMLIVITPIMYILSLDVPKESKFLKGVMVLAYVGYFWVLFWKVPSFVFSFFPLYQIVTYLFSFLLGVFVLGTLFYFATWLLLKIFIKKSYKRKL